MKRTFIALVALIIAGTSIFLACNKDSENEEVKKINTEKSLVQNEANPYDFVGQLHNEALDYTFAKYGSIDLPNEYIYTALQEFLLNKFDNINCIPTHSEFELYIENAHLTCFNFLTDNKFYLSIPENEYLSTAVNVMYQIVRENMETDNLLTPEDFSNKIALIEHMIVQQNQHSIPNGNSEMNIYDIVLANLSIARHSYQFWYSVVMDNSNPYHEEFIKLYLSDNKSACPGKFWKWVKNAISKIWDAAVAVTTFVSKDISSFSTTYTLLGKTNFNNYWRIATSIMVAAGTSASDNSKKTN